jgi:hypothetical protein
MGFWGRTMRVVWRFLLIYRAHAHQLRATNWLVGSVLVWTRYVSPTSPFWAIFAPTLPHNHATLVSWAYCILAERHRFGVHYEFQTRSFVVAVHQVGISDRGCAHAPQAPYGRFISAWRSSVVMLLGTYLHCAQSSSLYCLSSAAGREPYQRWCSLDQKRRVTVKLNHNWSLVTN